MSDSALLVNLGVALGAGLLGGVLALRLGQSVILGYIAAGIAIGPFTPGIVGDIATVQALADIGIVFLMFAIGAQVSFRDLLQAGRLAIIGGNIQVLAMIGVGYLAGSALGFPPLEALFFGTVISNSSSTVISKVLGERGELDSTYGRLSLAWSSVQDLGTVVLVVVLAALATGGTEVASDLLLALAKAGLFLLLLILLGSRALPWLFERVAALRNRELFVLTVAGVALGTAYAASLFGISLALGAFAAGVVVSESDLSHQILGEAMPLRDIFASLFFVSVGMLVNPLFAAQNLLLVLLTTALIVLAKGTISAAITALGGYSVRTSLLVGVALAQSAEFSFLLARVGSDLGVVTPHVFNLLLAAAVASIVLSPALHRAVQPLVQWLDRRLPLPALAGHPRLVRGVDPNLRGHVVICGYGRVGRIIVSALRRQRFPYIVIDEDPRVVARLRQRGEIAIAGNAANPVLLERVALERARILVLAIPDPVATRQIVAYALQRNPRLDIVARTHRAGERVFLQDHGVREAVLGELELALEMTRHTLRRFGLSSAETLAIIQGLRQRAEMEPQAGTPEEPS